MNTLSRLAGAAYGTHLADQIALVAVPLVAALAFDASPQLIGALVACQSSAHLLGSIPFGILVDQGRLRILMIASALLLLIGAAGATASILFSTTIGFGASIMLAGFGTMLFGLTGLSFVCAMSLPEFGSAPKPTAPILARIVEGGCYVIGHALLLPIALCAIFWNLAFAAMLVALVPVIQEVYRFDPGAFGIALAAFGAGAFMGTSLARRIGNKIAPKIVLLFGPGSSVVAAACLLLIGEGTSSFALYICFFALGFGPSMWLIAQNSVRQLVSPPAMLGRVNAVIQTAIYGVRPLGALLGGLVAGIFGPRTALAFVIASFAASFAVSLLSGLRSVESYASLEQPQ